MLLLCFNYIQIGFWTTGPQEPVILLWSPLFILVSLVYVTSFGYRSVQAFHLSLSDFFKGKIKDNEKIESEARQSNGEPSVHYENAECANAENAKLEHNHESVAVENEKNPQEKKKKKRKKKRDKSPSLVRDKKPDDLLSAKDGEKKATEFIKYEVKADMDNMYENHDSSQGGEKLSRWLHDKNMPPIDRLV